MILQITAPRVAGDHAPGQGCSEADLRGYAGFGAFGVFRVWGLGFRGLGFRWGDSDSRVYGFRV